MSAVLERAGLVSTLARHGTFVDEYERRRCPKGVRPVCSLCSFAITAGQAMAVLPHVDVRHWSCHEKASI